MQTGRIFDVKQYALHDGPGIRTTVFLKGCPLSCWWCHNPEGIDPEAQIVYRSRRCIGCGECVAACSHDALSLTADGVAKDDQKCQIIGTCAEICPTEAWELVGDVVTAEKILEIVKKDLPFYKQSNGGVTFSGGEPLMQPEFLSTCLMLCGQEGIHRVVDTSGYAEKSILEIISKETDLFLYDLKFMDSEKHKLYTGVSNQQILANLKYLARSGANVIVRFPLIPGLNDDDQNIDLVGMFLRVLPEIKMVHMLPYHGYQERKYALLDTQYRVKEIPRLTPEKLNQAKERLEDFGLSVELGG